MKRSITMTTSLIFCFFSLALDVATSPGGTKKVDAKDPYAEVERQVKEWNSLFATVRDESAEKEYKKSGAQITPWMKDAARPKPDNAALLYYQAFLLRPEPNMAISLKISAIVRGAEPDRQIRIYLGHCLPMIRLVEVASQMPQCSWGIWWGADPGFSASDLRSQVSGVIAILAVDAHTLAADGHFRAALGRCLTMRRLVRHLGSWGPDGLVLRTIQHVLGVMPSDADILTWFGGQLSLVPAVPLSFAETLEADFESAFHRMRTDPALLAKLRNRLVEKAEEEQTKESAGNLTDEQLLSLGRDPYARFLDSILRVLRSEMTYVQRYAEMQRLYRNFVKEYGDDSVVAHVIAWCSTDAMIVEQYPRYVGHIARFNGLRAAVEVYLVQAKTGKLPDKLPDYLPKDPFTDLAFGYDITDEGFALCCQGEEFLRNKRQLLEFNVKK